jgi:hypothetical protein
MITYHQYTTTQRDFIRELYTKEEYTLKLLTVEFNRRFKINLTTQQIKAALQRWRYKSPRKGGCRKGHIHSGSFKQGNDHGKKSTATHFKTGNVPWNKKLKD